MRIVPRSEWGAVKEKVRPAMRLPAAALWVHHSVTNPTGDPSADMRAIQRIGISRFGYLSYSYAAHPTGPILEGQALKVGAHTAGQNSTSFGVVLIGNYETRTPTDAQVDAVRWLTAHLIETGALKPGIYPTGGHQNAIDPDTGKPTATACPGRWAMQRLADMRVPWPLGAAGSGPPTVSRTDYPEGEAMLTRHVIDIPALDGQGRGWVELNIPADRVVSLIVNGPYPPVDGYWELPILARQDRGGKTIVSITEGQPNSPVNIAIWTIG